MRPPLLPGLRSLCASQTDLLDVLAAELVALLERFSYERKSEARAGWVALAIRDAGVPFEAIFAVFEELIATKVRPSFALSSFSRQT